MPRKTFTDKQGYNRFSNSGSPVHRWAAEKKLGRPLRDGEVVHHIDRNKKNNQSSNLWVFPSQAHHDQVHNQDARKYGKQYSYKGKGTKKG